MIFDATGNFHCYCGYGFQNLDLVVRQEDGSPIKSDSMTQKWAKLLEAHNLPKRNGTGTKIIFLGSTSAFFLSVYQDFYTEKLDKYIDMWYNLIVKKFNY